MAPQADTLEINMELADIPGTSLKVSRVARAIGGWMWGGTDEAQSVSTIHAALEHGINVIDTAPVYGFGRSEEIVRWQLDAPAKAEIDRILRETITDPVGPEFMAPPAGSIAA
jgi:predicted aldo/keto reductase-like oxidoreductase